MSSYKTSIGGLLMVVAAVADAVAKLYNGEPIDWSITMGMVTGGIAMMNARDNKVSDQQAGARPETSEL